MVGCHRGEIVACAFRDREDDPAANAVQRAVNIGGSTGPSKARPSIPFARRSARAAGLAHGVTL
ncbi:MAG: hypothetical protein ACUVYA_21245 [Planctomycetota bacterium]